MNVRGLSCGGMKPSSLPQFPLHGSDLLASGDNEEFLSCSDEDPWLLNPVATWPVLSRLDPEGWGEAI